MPDIAPFCGYHFDPVRVDVARALTPAEGAAVDDHQPSRLHGADGATIWNHWRTSGALRRDPSRAMYRMVQTGALGPDGRPQICRGVVAAVRISPYSEGRILPNQRTLAPAVERALANLRATAVQPTPIVGMYADAAGEVERTLRGSDRGPPILDVSTADGVRHQLWRISNAEVIGKLRRAFAAKKTVLADGHHRYQAMLAWHAEVGVGAELPQYASPHYTTMLLCDVAESGLEFAPAHRLLADVDGFDLSLLLQRARDYFIIEPMVDVGHSADAVVAGLAGSYGHQPAFLVAAAGQRDGWRFTLAPNVNLPALGIVGHPTVERFETSLVHTVVLERIIGLAGAELDRGRYVTYPRDTKAAHHALATGRCQVGFFVPANRADQLRHVADIGELMVPWATRLAMPIAPGLLFRHIDRDEDLQ
jgi:uncharacterized protein (DUF1015 family)